MTTQNDIIHGSGKQSSGLSQAKDSKRVYKYSDTSLMNYFRFIGNRKALSAKEEMAAAEHISHLEHTIWELLLGNKSTASYLAESLGQSVSFMTKPEEGVFENTRMKIREYLNASKASPKQTADDANLLAAAHDLYMLDEDRTLVASAINDVQTSKTLKKMTAIDGLKSKLKRLKKEVRESKNVFIQENLGLVVNIAKRYHVEKMPLADLIQEGNLGLIRAVDKFDYSKGFRFSTYASWWIRSYISRAIVRKSNTVRIPEYMLRDRNRIKRTEEASRVKNGRAPNEEELASELGLSQKRLSRTRKHDVAFVESLDREMPGSDNQRYIDFLSDEDAKGPLENVEFNAWVRDIPKTLSKLNVTERFVICWRFGLLDGEEMTLQEIGKCLNLSRERIRQIQEEALVKLRTRMEVDAA
jgi:RNA polymerase primary sigma factor